MDDIVVLALCDEAKGLFAEFANVFATGVGKVNSAIQVTRLIHEHRPRRVINLGTAGGITVGSGIHRVNRVIQHDVNVTVLGLAPGIHINDPDSQLTLPGDGRTCASGDLFVTEPSKLRVGCDLVDMEAYSIARAARVHGLEVEIWKYISDGADSGSGDEWTRNMSRGEQLYRQVLADLGAKLVRRQE